MTNTNDYFRAKEILQEAIAKLATERARFITDACGGDPDLEAEVKSLLDYHADDTPVLTAAESGS